ncbi:MAG: NAD-dependent isocitrate dehydrogenase [Kofleriaceae bacterium]|nr:NAD-dependent isocitrate dehydrogenase [Myxococcales bacterium]MCB9563467.1 NAD-dependent isocitrate dehydrogenase [Kofleriaceae bacterium]MCB9573011.1 NAD-dependent isocitrate dehydrogenase [Kofleriaceae bacterium]
MPYPAAPTVSLIEGDGIGPEISAATRRVVEAAGGRIAWEPVLAGMTAAEQLNDPLPPATLESIKKNQLALKGPLGTPIGGGFRSVNVTLRQTFDLYANVRPALTIPGVPSRFAGVDIVMVRENTEDLYAGVEHYVDPRRNAAESICIITRFGSERVITYAFEYARRHGRKKVTLVHKANILKMTNGLFLDVGREVAQRYPEIVFDDLIVDATAMKLVIAPERFDVIVTMNLFGDILSDLTAGLIGGLGVAPAANIGDGGCAIFEAVHGTAPDIAGQGIANPTGLMLSAVMLLEHVGQDEAAARMRRGIHTALANPETRTGDLGGKTNTAGYADAIVRAITS